MKQRRESPVRRVNPSGKVRFVARYTNAEGRRVSAGTFKRQSDAQDAIDAAYERPLAPDTLGAYAAIWTTRYPRAERTNATNDHRISRVLGVRIEGRELRHWPYADLRRRHVHELVDHLLRVDGRTHTGALNILRTLSAMTEDAISDEIAELNPFKGVKVRAADPRVRKQRRVTPVFTFAQMHRFAAAAGADEAILRCMSDCGLRLGEVLGLERRDFDGETLHVRGSAHKGRFTAGDHPTKRHVRSVPVSATLADLIATLPPRIDTPVLFPTAKGTIWLESNFRGQVWNPVRYLRHEAEGEEPGPLVFPDMQDATPHAFRHSWETHLHAAGIDAADLAEIAGHSLATMHGRYVHPLNRSAERVREIVG
jgi:integrase